MSDRFLDLLARARAGDPAAHDRLARALYAPVRRMLAGRFRRQPRDAIDDLTQEAMARIARLLPTCRASTERRFYAWAYRAARSAAFNYLASSGAGAADAQFVSFDAPRGGPHDKAVGTAARTLARGLSEVLADADALAEILARAEAVSGAAGGVQPAAGAHAAPASEDGPTSGRPGRGTPAARRGTSGSAVLRAGSAQSVRLQQLAVRVYGQLPPEAQLLLWLRLVERAEWADLGREFGATGAAVKRRFERACARLARDLSAHM